MPLLEIKRDQPKPRIIQMGQAPRVIEMPVDPVHVSVTDARIIGDEIELSLALVDRPHEQAAEVPIPDAPLEPRKPTRGRPKKMAKEKDLDHESGGPETIRKDDAGEQGAIGSHGENAPAQEKVPESS